MSDAKGRDAGLAKVRIWDRPTRIFHWVLVVLVVVCYLSGDNGRFDIHIPAGQALLVLVFARVLWGFVGSEPSRFRAFVRPLGEIAAHVRTLGKRVPGHHSGHNPLGGSPSSRCSPSSSSRRGSASSRWTSTVTTKGRSASS